MTIKPIKSDADYDSALAAIDVLMGAAADTAEADDLDVLVTLVEAYEAIHWPIEAPDPVSAIEHVMEARGLCQKDLAALIGSQSHASEVLNRRRPLTLPMIRALSAEWGLPADISFGNTPSLEAEASERRPALPRPTPESTARSRGASRS